MNKEKFGRGGVIPAPYMRPVRITRRDNGAALPDVDWNQVIIPVDDQHEGSCVARATCGLIEAMLRLHLGREAIPEGYQLDAARLYWESRKEHVPERWREDEGLRLEWAAETAIRLGLMPPDTEIVDVDALIPSIVAALYNGPLLQAHLVGENWLAPDEHGWIPRLDEDVILGGHATLLIGHRFRTASKGAPFRVLEICNSWGTDWGLNGLGRMDWVTWERSFHYWSRGPLAMKSNLWGHYEGWREWLIYEHEASGGHRPD